MDWIQIYYAVILAICLIKFIAENNLIAFLLWHAASLPIAGRMFEWW